MNELTTTAKKLPETIEEKTAYVLFGPEALRAYRKNLTAVKQKYGISSEQYKQIQLEAQETAENVLLYSVDIGNSMQEIEQTKGNRYSLPSASGSTKEQTIHNMGFTDRQARDFQTMAKHPNAVQSAIEDARKEDRIVTRQDVLNRIITPTRKNPLKEISKEAWRNHMKVEISPVVDLEDVKKDQENKNLIQAETKVRVLKMIETCTTISIIPDKDITGMWRKMDDRQKETLQRQLLNASKAISHILALSEE